MTDSSHPHKSISPHPTGPVGAYWLPTGPTGAGRLPFCATLLRRDCRRSTLLAGLGPRGPPCHQNRRGALSGCRVDVWFSDTARRICTSPTSASLAQIEVFVHMSGKPAPGGGCVANPLNLQGSPLSLTAKPRPPPGRVLWLVARLEMITTG